MSEQTSIAVHPYPEKLARTKNIHVKTETLVLIPEKDAIFDGEQSVGQIHVTGEDPQVV